MNVCYTSHFLATYVHLYAVTITYSFVTDRCTHRHTHTQKYTQAYIQWYSQAQACQGLGPTNKSVHPSNEGNTMIKCGFYYQFPYKLHYSPCMHAYTYAHTHMHMHIHIHKCIHMHTHIHTYKHMDTSHTYICTHTHTHAHTLIITYTHIAICA